MKKKIMLIAVAAAIVLSAASCGITFTPPETGTVAVTETEAITDSTIESETQTPVSVIKPGNYISQGNLKFIFESAKQYTEIKGEYFTDKPTDGNVYLILFFEVENISKEEQYVNAWNADAFIDDYIVNSITLMGNPNNYETLSATLRPGKKTKGYIAYEVDKNWSKLEVIYTDGYAPLSHEYNFEITPEDLS